MAEAISRRTVRRFEHLLFRPRRSVSHEDESVIAPFGPDDDCIAAEADRESHVERVLEFVFVCGQITLLVPHPVTANIDVSRAFSKEVSRVYVYIGGGHDGRVALDGDAGAERVDIVVARRALVGRELLQWGPRRAVTLGEIDRAVEVIHSSEPDHGRVSADG